MKYYETRLYSIYTNMKTRCYNPHCHAYDRYGGRGIKVCVEWLEDWWSFHDWAISNGYDDSLTIDRIDVNGNYEPSNCRWATTEEQAYNKRNTVRVEINGEYLTLKEIAVKYNINEHTVRTRYKKGLRGEDLILSGKNKPVICITTGEIYPSIKIAQEILGLFQISACCRGKLESCGRTANGEKMIWKYYKK